MVMQMLVMGGLRLTGDATWPMCEDGRSCWLPKKVGWLQEVVPGCVVKILNPDYYRPPPSDRFKFSCVWLDRNREEQVKSWVKYGKNLKKQQAMIRDLTPSQIRNIIKHRTERGVRVMCKISQGRFLRLRFEDILDDPAHAAMEMCRTFKCDLDTVKMAQAIMPRGHKCIDGFLEAGNMKPGVCNLR